MKKLLLAVLITSFSFAEITTQPVQNPITTQPVKPGFKDVLLAPIVGAVLLPVLVLGDVQKAFYEKRKICTADRSIFFVPCNKWPSAGETF